MFPIMPGIVMSPSKVDESDRQADQWRTEYLGDTGPGLLANGTYSTSCVDMDTVLRSILNENARRPGNLEIIAD